MTGNTSVDHDFLERVQRIDWSGVHHAYGPATDLPKLWANFLAKGDADGEFGNTICHQGTVYDATAKLLPVLIDLAGSSHHRQGDALYELVSILGTTGGPLQGRQRLAKRPILNPFDKKTFLVAAPDAQALAHETAWVDQMKADIEVQFDTWLDASMSGERRVQVGALCVLAAYRNHAQTNAAHARVRAAQPHLGAEDAELVRELLPVSR